MPLLNNFPLLVLALKSCSNNDEELLKEPEVDPLQGVSPNPEPEIPVTDPVKTQSEYMEEILCGRGGEGLFGSTKASDLFELKGTWVSSEGPESDQSRAFIRRKLDEGLDNGANYKIGEWLGDDWQIIEITKLRVVVLNQCGFEEVLEADFGVSELDSQPEPDPVRSEQEIVDSRDFGYVVDTQITEDGSTIEFYEDGTLENYSAELGDDGQPKLTMIYRYIPEQDAYQRYAANGTPTGDPLDREFLEEYMDIHIPKPE